MRWASVAVVAIMLAAHSAAAEETRPLIERLDDRTRGKVILALAGLVMLAFLLMGMAWLAFRIAQRQIRETRQVLDKQRRRSGDDQDWARKPLTDGVDEAG